MTSINNLDLRRAGKCLLTIQILLALTCGHLFSQDKFIQNYKVSNWFGFWKSLHLFTGMNVGITRVHGFREIVQQKEINTNFRKEIHYKTHASWSPFVFPELELNIDLFKLKQKTAGIQLQTNWYSTNRRMNYTRTVYSWEMNSPEIDEIKPRQHRIEKFEADLGVYLRW